ncbi:hypothetical protein E2C01_049663 [Portunus trituberculatus]|uniref:Uncharacterized protein n=1 Tax=Portunus trituberculatus TaxID=210409 RepID=A0A5B7GDQ4_PORTR|nr:hypothetical protein [Portunus trituberculatus]
MRKPSHEQSGKRVTIARTQAPSAPLLQESDHQKATPVSGAAHKLIPPRSENSLEAPDTAGVCTTLTARATVGSRAALKLTHPKIEKSAEEPKTAEDWTPTLSQGQTMERGRTYANSTEPRKLRGRARNSERRHATRYWRRGRERGRMQTHSHDHQLRGRAWNRGSLPPTHSRSQTREKLGPPYTNLGGGRTLAPPSANPENVEPEARGNKTTDNWPTEAFIAARSASTATNLLAQGASETGSCWRERFALEQPDDLVRFFSLAERFSASFLGLITLTGRKLTT